MLALRTVFFALPLLLTGVDAIAVPNDVGSSLDSRDIVLDVRGVNCNTNQYAKKCMPNGNIQQCQMVSAKAFEWVEYKCTKGPCSGTGGKEACKY